MKTGQVQLQLCSLQKVLEKNAFELWARHSCIRNKQACFHSTTTFKHVQRCAAELFAAKEAHEVHCHVHTVHYSGDTEERSSHGTGMMSFCFAEDWSVLRKTHFTCIVAVFEVQLLWMDGSACPGQLGMGH
jgi:hypothetical protein